MQRVVEVRRDDFERLRLQETPTPEPQPGQAVLEVERFGCSSNNVTYAVLGDALRYWLVFPAGEGWGRIPVWGFARVVASASPLLEAGTRVFGYCPMSSHLVLTPSRPTATGFADASPHRAGLAPTYNTYRLLDADPAYERGREDEQLLLRPLFLLSFLLDDLLAERDQFGADAVVVSSASSKAALGTAFLLGRRGVPVLGLTSARNVDLVAALDVYEHVAAYESAEALPREAVVLVDLAGSDAVRRAVERRFGDALRHSVVAGATHADASGFTGDGRGDPDVFFLPDRLRARVREWGQAEVDRCFADAWRPLLAWCDGWLAIDHARGPAEVMAVVRRILAGDVDPARGHVLSL